MSAVSWIVTANDATPLRGPLLTRLRQVHMPPPRPEDIEAVLHGVRRDVAAAFQVGVDDLPELAEEAEDAIRKGCKRGISLRRVRVAYERALLIAEPRRGGLH